jgi:hypothetical protein
MKLNIDAIDLSSLTQGTLSPQAHAMNSLEILESLKMPFFMPLSRGHMHES